MQIQTANTAPLMRSLSSPPSSDPPNPQGPKDSFAKDVGKESLRTAVGYANAFGTVTGGAVGVASMVPAMYAGVLGGAVFGAALGGGIGPVIGAVGSHGALNFIGTAFSTAGLFAKAGMVVGGLAGASGGWTVGNTIGGLAGKLPGGAVGLGVGALKGGWNHAQGISGAALPSTDKPGEPAPAPEEDLNKMSGVGKFAASVVAGTGLLGGTIGGAALGAGVMSAGSLASGLLAKDLTWSALTGAAQGGAIGGAIIFGVIGAVGGWNLVKAGEATIKGSIKKFHEGQQWLQLDKKENRLREQKEKLDGLEASINKAHTEAVADIRNRTQELDGRQGVVGDKEAEFQLKTANEGKLATERADELYKDEKGRLVKTEGDLNREKVRLDGEKKRIDTKEEQIPQLVDQRAAQMTRDLENGLEGKYQDRKGKLGEREREIDRREAAIPSTVNQKVEAELKPLKDNISSTRRQADNLNRQADQMHSEAVHTMAQIPVVQSQTSAERDRADSLRREGDTLHGQFTQINQEVRDSRTSLEQKQTHNSGLLQDLQACQAEHKQ